MLTLAMLLLMLGTPTVACEKKADNGNWNALPPASHFEADVAIEWFNLLSEITRTKPFFPPPALRIFAYSGLALYEAVVPGIPDYQSIYKHFTGNPIPIDKQKDHYWPASANAAIARIASRIIQNYPAPDLASIQALEASLNTTFSTKVTPRQLQASIEFGRQVADLIYAWSKTDGTFNPDGTLTACPPHAPSNAPGSWVPTPPAFLPAIGGCQGALRTFIPNVASAVSTLPPPAYSTEPASAFYCAAAETYEARNNITTEQTRMFNNWRDAAPNYNPLAHMLLLATGIIKKENRNLEESATIYAKLTIASSDAIGATFKYKFQHSLLRPVTYVRNVMGDTNWLSLPVTPQTPSYPDESSATASSIAILEKYFGTNYAFVDSTHKATHGLFSYASFNQLMHEIVQARVSGGTIFCFAGKAGTDLGRQVGNLVDQLPFRKN